MTFIYTAIIIIVMGGLVIFFEKWKKRDERKRVLQLKKEIDFLLSMDEHEHAITD